MSDQVTADAQTGGPAPDVPSSGAAAAASDAAAAVTDRAKGVLTQTAPWRRGVGWPVLAIEGGIALAAGIYVFIDPDKAQDIVRQVLGAVLLINSLLRILHGFRDNAQGLPGTPYRLVTGGIGLTVGAIVLFEPLSDFITEDAARVILAFGFLAFGVIGLAGAFGTRESGGLRRGALITGVLYTVFAILLFYNARRESLKMEYFGVVFILFGLLLLGYAFMLYRAAQTGDVEASTAAV